MEKLDGGEDEYNLNGMGGKSEVFLLTTAKIEQKTCQHKACAFNQSVHSIKMQSLLGSCLDLVYG
jgi:hypothetical protein